PTSSTPMMKMRTHPPLSIFTAMVFPPSPAYLPPGLPIRASVMISQVRFIRQAQSEGPQNRSTPLRSALRLFRGDGFFCRRGRCGCLRRRESHLNLELIHQFARLQLLRLVLDLDLLLIYVAHGHIHPGFVDRSYLFDLAHHLVVRLADTGNLELLHRIRHLLLPLGAAVVGDGV